LAVAVAAQQAKVKKAATAALLKWVEVQVSTLILPAVAVADLCLL
jgi:hypothetical protein